jgi:hypothetical protein
MSVMTEVSNKSEVVGPVSVDLGGRSYGTETSSYASSS